MQERLEGSVLFVLAKGTVCFICTKQAAVQYSAIERASFAFASCKGSDGPELSVIAAVLFFFGKESYGKGQERSYDGGSGDGL
jgi:hypothetical protein